MGKKIRGVKLKAEDINKNNGKEISHTINKIIANERKYTIMLVMFFIVLFLTMGYFLLSSDIRKINNNYNSNITIKAPSILLTDDDVMDDSQGLNSNNIELEIINNTEVDTNYRIVLKEDINEKKKCGCINESFNVKNIRYSFDGNNIKKISNNLNVVATGVLKSYEKEKLNFRMWLSNNDGSHFHGKFVIEKIKIED